MSGSIGSIGYRDRLWADVPCTVDELARVMTHVNSVDVNPNRSPPDPCPSTWECAPGNEINLSETLPLRFRVMVNRLKGVAFAAFRCTDVTKLADVKLDLRVVNESWSNEQARKAVEAWGNIPSEYDWFFQFLVGFTGVPAKAITKASDTFAPKLSSFQSVIKANKYIEAKVQPWARRKNYTLVVGGYSLGGFIAQYVGYHQNLYNVSFDGLWGVKTFLTLPLNEAKISKCATICYSSDSVISWPKSQIGRQLQTPRLPKATETDIHNKSSMGYLGHSMFFFYDQLNPPRYSPPPSEKDILARYVVFPSIQDPLDLCRLRAAAEAFRNNEISEGANLFFRVHKDFKNAVYHQMYLIKRHEYGEQWELGMKCFESVEKFSSTPEEKAQAINAVLITLLRRS